MISFIIPNYPTENAKGLLATCLEGLWGRGQILAIIDTASFAENVNRGLKQATGDILVIVNNDLQFIQDDWLEHLTNPLKDYDICSIRTTEEGWDAEDRLEEDAKFGSLWAMNRKVYDTIGGLDENFGNYFEDLDYHQRAKDAGFKVVKNHNGLVEHIGKATFKEVDPEDEQYNKAMQKFIEKWGHVW